MPVVPAFLPPPPLPAVAKLHQKPSALCELFHFHNLPGGREPSGWQFKDTPREKQTYWLAFRPPWNTWGHLLVLPNPGAMCKRTQLPYEGIGMWVSTAHSGRVTSAAASHPAMTTQRAVGHYDPCPSQQIKARWAQNPPACPEPRPSTSSHSGSPPPILGWGPEVPMQSVPGCGRGNSPKSH